MKFRVKVRPQVWQYASSLGLEHRRSFKRAVLGLGEERGDIRALCEELAGFYRLKVAHYRVIFWYRPGSVIECVFEDWQNGRYKVISFFAKRARGLMARQAITQRIATPAGLEAFDAEGYRFEPAASVRDRLVFRRRVE